MSGLYYAREAAGLTRSELVAKSGMTKQQLGRLENGGTRLRIDHVSPLASHLGYMPEEILFWDQRHPPTGHHHPAADHHIESSDVLAPEPERNEERAVDARNVIREALAFSGAGGGGVPSTEERHHGNYADPLKPEGWSFPSDFLREIGASASRLLMLELRGDSMEPTLGSGERVVADIWHKQPSPDGIYALRDAFGAIIVKRLQLVRTRPPRLKIISDNPNHPPEEVGLDEVEIVGKVLVALRRF